MSLLRFSLFCILVCSAPLTPAQASLTICNKTPSSLSLSVAFETSQDLVSQGWWTLEPEQCQTTLPTPLDHQYYYHYAVSSALKVEWTGNFNFCTSDEQQFRIVGAQACEQRNYHTTGFRQIDVGTNKDYTLNIRSAAETTTPPPPQATLAPINSTTTPQ